MNQMQYSPMLQMQEITRLHSSDSENAVNHEDPEETTPGKSVEEKRIKFTPSIIIVAAITFVGDSSRGILFPVLWPLCQSLGGNTLHLGFLVSTFSLGRFVITTPLGYFCDSYRHKLSLIISNIVLVGGALLWANSYAIGSLGFLYFAQFVMGVGSGSLGVTRSFVVEQYLPKHRTEILATMTALQYAGFTVSPFLGAYLGVAGKGDGSNLYWEFALPAYFIALLAFYCTIALFVTFEDLPKDLSPTTNSQTAVNKTAEQPKEEVLQLIMIFIFLNITTKGSIAVYETLASEIAYTDYNLSSTTLGLLVSASGILGFIQLIKFDFWTSRMNDYSLMKFGILIMMIAQFIICSYGNALPSVSQFFVCMILMYGFGYPIGHTAVLGAFSKIQKKGKQAGLLGYFATAGSFARILFPSVSGILNQEAKNSPFMLALIVLGLSVVYIIIMKSSIYEIILEQKKPTITVADARDESKEEGGEDGRKTVKPAEEVITLWEKRFVYFCIAAMIFGVVVISTSTPDNASSSFFIPPEDVRVGENGEDFDDEHRHHQDGHGH